MQPPNAKYILHLDFDSPQDDHSVQYLHSRGEKKMRERSC